jgi:hypothetical protein
MSAYLADEVDLYTFDADHAMLAYPLAVLLHVGERLKLGNGVGFDVDELGFLTNKCCDNQGRLPLSSVFQAMVF